MRAAKQSIISFRMDADLKPVVDQWLNQHPGFNISRFLNLAAREYAFLTVALLFRIHPSLLV